MIVGRFSPKQLLLALAAISSVSAQTSSPTATPTVSPTPPPTNNPTMAPSMSPTTNPTGSPTRTCMVTVANGTTYTASDFADATSWVSYDASTSTLTCNRGRTSPFISGVCMGVTVEYCSVLECTAPATCYNATTTSVPTVHCTDDRACALGTLNSPSYLECKGPSACALTSVTLPDSAVVECEYGGCTSTKMEPTDSGVGITVSCTGTATTCAGTYGIDVGQGEITCTGTAATTGPLYTCTGRFNANCLRCETEGSCGGNCAVNSTDGLASCSEPVEGSYGACDMVPTGSPTKSMMPTTSPAPTVGGCRVTLEDGEYMPASEFAQLYAGVTYYRGPFDETLTCFFGTACQNITITDCSILQCLGNSTCSDTKSMSNTNVLCGSERSCVQATITSSVEVQCRGSFACQQASITGLTGQVPRVLCDSNYGTEPSPCYASMISSTATNATLVCHGPYACDGSMTVDLENGNVLCIGVVAVPFSDEIANLPEDAAACTDSKFTSSCLTCYGASDTSCGNNCQYNDTSNSDGFGSCDTSEDFLVLGSCPWNIDTSGSDLAQHLPSTGVLIGSAMFVLSFLVL